MPSIFGVTDSDSLDVEQIGQGMFEALSTRGGDAESLHREEQTMLGVRGDETYVRKALLTNTANSVVAVIEGEIYNIGELRRLAQLPDLTSDNVFEAIIPLYEKFGKDFPRHLNGIFAIALWDNKTKTLYLVRDHIGSHSVFYTQHGKGLMFASAIQAILKTGVAARDISLSSLYAYFSSSAISPPKTMFSRIFCVRPGHITICSDGKIQEYGYWDSGALREDYQRKESEWAEEVREIILDAIRIRADYGGNYGTLLSGGTDTSIIAAVLTQYRNTPLSGFSIAFAETFYSDEELQKIMYARYNISPHVATLGAKEFAEILRKCVAHLDSPVNDGAMVGMYKVFELAKQNGYSIVFDGEAADELFFTGAAVGELAFQKYLAIPFDIRRRTFGRLFRSVLLGDSLWHKGCRFFYRLGLSDEERILTRIPCFYKHKTPILRHHQAVAHDDPLEIGKQYFSQSALQDPLNYQQYGIVKTYLPNDLLFKNERMAAAHGIINRTPFIDYRLVESAFRIPSIYKASRATADSDGTKLIYKKAAHGLIPDEILYRKKKRGFSQPTSIWYRGELRDFVHDILFSRDSLCSDYVDKAYMSELVAIHQSGKADIRYLLTSLLVFELWLRAFVK